MRKLLLSHYFIGVLLLALVLGGYFYGGRYVDQLRYKTFDLYQNIAPRTPAPEKMAAEVRIIDIDEAALKAYGQWPWPRTLLARLVDKLTEAGVAVVGFDVVFAEKDRTSPSMVAATIADETVKQQLANLPENESVFAESIGKGRVVLGQSGTAEETGIANLIRKVGFGVKGQDITPWLSRYPGLVRNLPELEAPAKGLGLFSIVPDEDGIYRRITLMERVGDVIYPSLSAEMLRVALGGEDDYLIKARPLGGVQSLVVKTAQKGVFFEIPTDSRGRVWVHYAKHQVAPPLYISAKDVLDGTAPNMQGNLVIIGTSAIGLKDIRATPISGSMPGVEVHAQLLETILSQSYLTRSDMSRPDRSIAIEIGFILGAGLLMIVLVPRLNALTIFLLASALMASLMGIAWYGYSVRRELIDASYPSLAITLFFMVLSYLNYMREEKERAKIKTAFSHYVSPALLDQLAANPEKLKLGGETRNITILFSDIRGFTTISEQFNAEELTRFINGFLTPMTNVILENKGTIDKYMGDAIMAFWNAPLDDPDHPKNACLAALAMQIAVQSLNEKLKAEAEKEGRKHINVAIGVGLNTGDCCVGNMGSDLRFDYSALGDDVNLASRLEGQSKPYGVGIVLGENTVAALGDSFAVMELDWIKVKGKTEPVTIYALLGDETRRASDAFQSLLRSNGDMLASYRAKEWTKAENTARMLRDAWPELAGFYALYLERIAEFRLTPPPADWDGVFVATSK